MKAVKLLQSVILVLAVGLTFSIEVSAQGEKPEKRERIGQVTIGKEKEPNEKKIEPPKSEIEKPNAEAVKTETPTPDKTDDKTEKMSEEEAAILPYYNNYLKEYRLGPNDVISVEVFGQCPDYCKMSIAVPPTARISYPLIREGVMVGGKTVEEVADEITKKLDEYIIDPKVTVTLDKAMSVRYSVLGKVAAPGVRIMDRKVSIYEAIIESGGVLKEGDKKRVMIYSYDAQGRITPKAIDLTEIERGKAEMVFLSPGDQVFVPD
ncbi:MAG TPA: polysaccharide biosynthesis/export family protein, partial [Pyrinomonadaceae bacterium]|nr:polysaccharide biosynthesis/export family protein [Pyrinomonadaceae bacterium]